MVMETLQIEGMACPMCEAHINEALRRAVPDAKKIRSSYKTGIATIICKVAESEEGVRMEVENAGYKMVSLTVSPYEERKGCFLRRLFM